MKAILKDQLSSPKGVATPSNNLMLLSDATPKRGSGHLNFNTALKLSSQLHSDTLSPTPSVLNKNN